MSSKAVAIQCVLVADFCIMSHYNALVVERDKQIAELNQTVFELENPNSGLDDMYFTDSDNS